VFNPWLFLIQLRPKEWIVLHSRTGNFLSVIFLSFLGFRPAAGLNHPPRDYRRRSC
jgi:hypothetical protein